MLPEEIISATNCISFWVIKRYGDVIDKKPKTSIEPQNSEVYTDYDKLQKNSSFFNSNILEQYHEVSKANRSSNYSSGRQKETLSGLQISVSSEGRRVSDSSFSASLSWNNDVIQRETLNLKLPSPVPTRIVAPQGRQPFSRRRLQNNEGAYNLRVPNLEALKELGEVMDKRNVFTKRRDRENPFFVSQDRQENDDINDRGWEKMKNLRNDRDRKFFAMKAFGNKKPADPTKNLGYHGFFRKRLSQEGRGQMKNRRHLMFKDLVIKDGRLECLDEDKQQFNSKKRKASVEIAPPAKRARRVIPMYKFEEDLESIVINQKRKIMKLTHLRYFVRHWRHCVQETISFYKYYDDDNENRIDFEELCKNDATERLFVQFSNFYGIGEPTECKDCSFEDSRRIVHFM